MDEEHDEPQFVLEPRLGSGFNHADRQRYARLRNEAEAVLSESLSFVVIVIDREGRQRVVSGVGLSSKKELRRFFANAIHAMKLMQAKAE